ncbi:beta-lactamase/transpeptidase-like protein [Calycina marina]|uniref:Beta-lactamase/transpeptidase-like protein n=1 Tax=Calycina marina TaxID=1763456 RepID=A0A9P7YV06_9HELO|nr:beta-lactamase/transpeptidase-like protein [Calycina marina]
MPGSVQTGNFCDSIKEIQKMVQMPSITYGVIHEGEVICDSIGSIDRTTGIPVDSNTLYSLVSVSKGFLSALAGISVSERKLSWTVPISTYLPDFNPFGDLEICKDSGLS